MSFIAVTDASPVPLPLMPALSHLTVGQVSRALRGFGSARVPAALFGACLHPDPDGLACLIVRQLGCGAWIL